MRMLAAVLILFAAIVTFGFWTNHLLSKSSGELLQDVEQIAAELESNHWDEACEQTAKLEKTWDEKAKWWPAVLDHQEIDNIEFALGRFKEYVVSQNTALAWGQLSELRLMIKHIPEKEAIKLQNIF